MSDSLKLATTVSQNVVRVSLPAEIAHDYEKFSRIQKDILGRLGCMACCSGWDIRWNVFRDFHIDEQLNVRVGPSF